MRGFVGSVHQSVSAGRTIARPLQWRYHVSVQAHNPPKCERFGGKIVRKTNNWSAIGRKTAYTFADRAPYERCQMPELPEVETVRRGLQPAMEGAKIVKAEARRKDLRFPFQKDFAARLEGQTVTGLGRRAKYLMADLSSGDVLLMHLGMSGSFRVLNGDDADTPGTFHRARSTRRDHDHVVFHMSSGAAVVFNDPRRFGYMKVIAREALDEEPLLRGLGPEPLGNAFDAKMLAKSCHNKKTSLKAALLDQRVVAGLGNIYVCEALYRAHLSPKRKASTLVQRSGAPADHARRLAEAIRTVLGEAIEAGGSSLRDHRQTSGELGYFQHNFRVYDREGERCRSHGCAGTIKRFTQNGRSTFWCPACQK
jgi:formamidopyrimidine-DNA glycosylase